eukprot:6286751-Prymnesium_polylepis.1
MCVRALRVDGTWHADGARVCVCSCSRASVSPRATSLTLAASHVAASAAVPSEPIRASRPCPPRATRPLRDASSTCAAPPSTIIAPPRAARARPVHPR